MINLRERTSGREIVQSLSMVNEVVLSRMIMVLAISAGTFLRIWQIDAMGYNTDEAVYSGQAAAIAGVPVLKDIFPIFRAHPLLFQFLLSLLYRIQFSDLLGRLLAVAIGIATLFLTYQIGKTLYGPLPGALAAAFMALMPYHIIVSRQVLLDGPMTFFATLTLYMLAQFGRTQRSSWLYAAGAAMGLTFLSKETSIVMVGAIFTFLALASELRTRIRDVVVSVVLMGLVIAPFPIAITLAGGSTTGRNYLVWQLFRRPNHEWSFYLTSLPVEIGILVIVAAVLGLFFLRRSRSWREKLLMSWILVPFVFFNIWPVKGFQYLLPIAPPLALLAGRALGRLVMKVRNERQVFNLSSLFNLPVVHWSMIAIVFISVGWTSWQQIQPRTSYTFLAGTGGVPGGREAGIWIQANVPQNATFMTIGPSMANIIQFYGARSAAGLAVSPNPLHRNPSYDPINNPDQQLRTSNLQYLVWDSFSAERSAFFSDKLLSYVKKYNGRAVHTESVTIQDENGNTVVKPVIIIFEVHP
jgi:4-amino-4-deoxy-L-arabinose transferase-like glycosyltransferase